MHIGPALTEARTEAGMTVEDVSERTRIRRTIITDIERDDYTSCGGDFYARGHIRAIAKVVGADPVPLIKEYDADVAARDNIELQTGPDPRTWLQAEGRADPLLWQPAAAPEPGEQAATAAVGDFAAPVTAGLDAPAGQDSTKTQFLIGDQATQFLRGDWAADGPRAPGSQETAPQPILPSGPPLSSAGLSRPARGAGSAGACAPAPPTRCAAARRARARQARPRCTGPPPASGRPARSWPPGSRPGLVWPGRSPGLDSPGPDSPGLDSSTCPARCGTPRLSFAGRAPRRYSGCPGCGPRIRAPAGSSVLPRSRWPR